MWRGRKICSHTFAAAESVGRLSEFLQSLQKSKPELNVTNLVMTTKDRKAAGTKCAKPSRKGGSNRHKTPITSYESRLDTVCASSMDSSAGSRSDVRSSPCSGGNITSKGHRPSLSAHGSVSAGGSINVSCNS